MGVKMLSGRLRLMFLVCSILRLLEFVCRVESLRIYDDFNNIPSKYLSILKLYIFTVNRNREYFLINRTQNILCIGR